MGQLQVTQIKKRLEDTLVSLIDLSDLPAHSQEHVEVNGLSRALAAFVIMKLAGVDEITAAASVTDGSRDNGIDAIIALPNELRVVVVQSKWSSQGRGSASLDDVLKLREGVNDLVQFKWDKFNDKVQDRRTELESILLQENVIINIVFAHNGSATIASDVRSRIDEYVDDLNEPTETASFLYLSQAEIRKFLVDEQQSPRIDLTVELSDWGQVESSPRAIYGQVAADEVANWYINHGSTLLDKNVRVVLSESEVNNSLATTLVERPNLFWYFNNGITVLCDEIVKTPAGGTDRRLGTFAFQGVTVVNGAQTVGTIAKIKKKNEATLGLARVMVRFISLSDTDDSFASDVTRATNTQNRIGGRDFLSLDLQQARLRDDFAIEGLKYVYRSGEEEPQPTEGCSVFEATVALACAQGSSSLAVQAKREISRLWDDTSRAPYKTLFNARTSYLRVWRSVDILRRVQGTLEHLSQSLEGRPRLVAVHGNRLILHLVFRKLNVESIGDPSFDWEAEVDRYKSDLTTTVFNEVASIVESDYPGYPASLFKNASKCATLSESVLASLDRKQI